jgi:hypothetical protein
MKPLNFGRTDKIELKLDPFKVSCLESVMIMIRKPYCGNPGDPFMLYAKIDFKNGLTKGEHEIRGDGKTLQELIKEVEIFVESLEK